jgi:HNH endonuclease
MAKRGDPRLSAGYKMVRLRVLHRDNYVCYYCGGDANQVDHVVPISKQGDVMDMDNMVAACKRCNVAKGDRSQCLFKSYLPDHRRNSPDRPLYGPTSPRPYRMSTKVKPIKRGLVEPRLHSPFLKGKSRIDEVAQLAEKIGMPLLPWQHFVLEDMLRVDADGGFIRKTNLLLCARQNGKTHLARMRILAGMFLFDEKKILIMSSNRAMALSTFREVAYAIEGSPELKKQIKAIRYAARCCSCYPRWLAWPYS